MLLRKRLHGVAADVSRRRYIPLGNQRRLTSAATMNMNHPGLSSFRKVWPLPMPPGSCITHKPCTPLFAFPVWFAAQTRDRGGRTLRLGLADRANERNSFGVEMRRRRLPRVASPSFVILLRHPPSSKALRRAGEHCGGRESNPEGRQSWALRRNPVGIQGIRQPRFG